MARYWLPLVVLGCAGLFWLWFPDEQTDSSNASSREARGHVDDPSSRPSKDLAVVRSQLGALRDTVRSLESELAQVQAKSRDESAPLPVQPENPDKDTAPPMSAREEEEETMAFYEDVLTSEPLDRAWSERYQVEIQEQFELMQLAGSHAETIECRSTLCRIEVTHIDHPSRTRFMAGPRVPFLRYGGTLVKFGDLSTVAYVPRDEGGLPSQPDPS